MARILVIAPSGFGKTFSIAQIPELDHIGLDPKTTYYISTTGRPLLFPGGNLYKTTDLANITKGNRINTNNASEIVKILTQLQKSPFENIVIDDFNYVMQDYYMKNAFKGGWQTPKEIGAFMNDIFEALKLYESNEKNVILLAHSISTLSPDNRTIYQMKTTGNMTDEFITPSGKVDIILVGISKYDSSQKKVIKEFITEETDLIIGAKAGYKMLPSAISNDLGLVIKKLKEYYG